MRGHGDAARAPSKTLSRSLTGLGRLSFGLVVAAVLLIGWLQSDSGHLSPESGLGYWLGIAGAMAMLLLLVYPLRKRMKGLRAIGSVTFWFRFHMVLGILGPCLVVLHSNFKLGSLNSNVALTTMLIVAASGIVGRYLYGKIHVGLDGRKAHVELLIADAARLQVSIAEHLPANTAIVAALNDFAGTSIQRRPGAVSSAVAWLTLGSRIRSLRRKQLQIAVNAIESKSRKQGWSRRERKHRIAEMRVLLRSFGSAINKVAKFAFFERLFGLWHVLHLPLFVLLVLAALAHVLAVHLY